MKHQLTKDQIQRLMELGMPEAVTPLQLLAVLPKKVSDRKRIYGLRMWVDHYSDAWCIEYRHHSELIDLDSFQNANELIDAMYAMACWLKTEGKELVWL